MAVHYVQSGHGPTDPIVTAFCPYPCYLAANTTASGRVTRRASERSGVQEAVWMHRLSFREGPAGQEGETHARLAKFVPCALGMQVPCSADSQVEEASVLRAVIRKN
jgi:hypothetical protein